MAPAHSHLQDRGRVARKCRFGRVGIFASGLGTVRCGVGNSFSKRVTVNRPIDHEKMQAPRTGIVEFGELGHIMDIASPGGGREAARFACPR